MLLNVIKFIALAYIVAFCQTILANITEIANSSPDYGTIIIVLVVLRADYRSAFTAALLVGLVLDCLNPQLLGVGTAVRFSIAVALWELKRTVDLGRVSTRIYLLLGAEGVYQLLYQTFAGNFSLNNLPHVLLSVSLPTLIYTTVMGLIVLMIADLSVKIEIRKGDSGSEAV